MINLEILKKLSETLTSEKYDYLKANYSYIQNSEDDDEGWPNDLDHKIGKIEITEDCVIITDIPDFDQYRIDMRDVESIIFRDVYGIKYDTIIAGGRLKLDSL